MIARAALVLALLGAVVGCTTVVASADQATDGSRATKKRPDRVRVVVTVVNGDTHRRVRGARVTVGGRSARTNGRGEARLVLRRRTALMVGVRAKNYADKSVRMSFKKRRKVTVRVYRPALQWRMYGADHTRTQAQTEIQVRPPFKVVWSRGIGSLIEFPAVVSDGVAFIGNYKGTIHAIEMRKGKLVWRYDPPGGKMASSPAVVGNRLVVHGMDGVVRVLRRRDGKLLGARRIGSPIESSPVVRGNVDYFGTWNGRVYALDLRTFRFRWVRRTGAKITSSAALRGKTLYIGNYGGRILALATGTGRVRWSRGVNGRIYGTPAVAAGRVFVPSSTGGSLTAFATSGRRLWQIATGSYVYSSPAVWAGRVYFGSYNGRLYAASARRGRVLWTVRAGGPISGAPVVVSGIVYAGHTRGGIVGADGRTGRIRFRFPHGEYVPVSGNGRRLLLHGYSRLYAVEPAAKPLRQTQ